MTWTEKLSNWFKAGKEESDTVLGIPWDVEVKKQEDQKMIVASHPKIPFSICINLSKQFANLYIDPEIKTDAMDVSDRMRIYKKLLHINTELNLMKAALVGNEDKLVIIVDLDLASLNKEEFNDALTLLIMGAARIIEVMGLTKELSDSLIERHVAIVISKLKKGESKEDILEFLIQRVGFEKKYAENFMEKVIEIVESKEDRKSSPAKPVPDHMYR